jgi:hypothetical protein
MRKKVKKGAYGCLVRAWRGSRLEAPRSILRLLFLFLPLLSSAMILSLRSFVMCRVFLSKAMHKSYQAHLNVEFTIIKSTIGRLYMEP